MRFVSKISSLEEKVDLDTMNMDELHGILTAYVMRREQQNSVTKEETFKESNNKKIKEKSNSSISDILEDDDEVVKFIKRMKKGTIRYKGNLSLICFDCDGIGHFTNKFPHKKNKRDEYDDPKGKQVQKRKIDTNHFSKRIYCTKEDRSSLEEYEDEYEYTKRFFFMEVEDSDDELSEK